MSHLFRCQRPEVGFRVSGTGDVDGCQPHGCWEWNSGPLEDQQEPLTPEPPLQLCLLPPSSALKMSSLSLMSRRLVIVWLCRVSAFLENVGYNFYQIWEMFGYDFCLCNSLPHLLLRLQILMPGVHVISQPLVLSYFFQSYSLPCLLFLFSLLAHCWFFFSLLLFNVSPAVTTTGWTLEIFTARNVKCISLFSLCFLS